jgi:hypothetical protein
VAFPKKNNNKNRKVKKSYVKKISGVKSDIAGKESKYFTFPSTYQCNLCIYLFNKKYKLFTHTHATHAYVKRRKWLWHCQSVTFSFSVALFTLSKICFRSWALLMCHSILMVNIITHMVWFGLANLTGI